MLQASIGFILTNTDVIRERISLTLYLFVKRLMDVVVSTCAVTMLLPVFALLALLIRLDSKGPAFYKHKRIGKDGEYIYLYKFRTMVTNGDEVLKNLSPEQKKEWEENYKLKDDPRITRMGKILRRTSLDELPQFFNIINGDMSLIGPRPVVDGEIEKYGRNKEKFLSVMPGLTGWWAVNGRSCTNYEDRKKLELYYVDNRSTLLDIKIAFMTFVTVIKREGAN